MRSTPAAILCILFFILSPSANTVLHAQFTEVLAADSTAEWWVRQKGGNLYYGYVRALGVDSINVIEGERGEKHLAIKDIKSITPKGARVVPIKQTARKQYGLHMQPFLYNALPHRNEVYLKFRYYFTPEVEVNFLKRHTLAGFFSASFEQSKTSHSGLRYRYATPINERLHWSLGLMYLRSNESQHSAHLSKNQVFFTTVITYDTRFGQLSGGPIFVYHNTPPSPFTRSRYGSGAAFTTMAQLPLGKYFCLNADWIIVPQYATENLAFRNVDYSGHSLVFGIKFHVRLLHIQLNYVERNSIESGSYWFGGFQRYRGTFSFRFGNK